MYDEAVLDFPFERGLDAIKLLPKTLKYNMIINNYFCRYDCVLRTSHWKMGGDYSSTELYCQPINLLANRNFNEASNIINKFMLFYIKDLQYFDDYINNFKIQGRENSTEDIIGELLYLSCPDERMHDISYFNDAIKDGTISLNI